MTQLQPACIAQAVRRRVFDIQGSNPVGARFFSFFSSFFFLFFYIQMFFYTIMRLFIALLENVNKSRTSAGSLSLKKENCTTHHHPHPTPTQEKKRIENATHNFFVDVPIVIILSKVVVLLLVL
jgi:hypothetical protein